MTELQAKTSELKFPLSIDLAACQIRPIGEKDQSWLVIDSDENVLCVLKSVDSFTDGRVAECLGKISHAGLPRYYGKFHIKKLQQDCYIFEYLPGRILRDFIGPDQDYGLLMSLAVKICRLLVFLRCLPGQEIWHLDLKPENIVISDQLEPGLIDFASSCLADSSRDEKSGPQEVELSNQKIIDTAENNERSSCRPRQFSCTPGYAAPEMRTGRPHNSSDLYSLAATCLVMLSRDSTSSGKSVSELARLASPEVMAALADYLQADPLLRPQRPEQLVFDLAQAAAKSGCDLLCTREDEKTETEHEIKRKKESAICAQTDNLLKTADNEEISRVSESPVICIWNSAEMACEMAACIAKSGQEVLLIDSEWLDSRTDLLLGIKNISHSGIREVFAGNLDNALSAAFGNTLDSSRLHELVQQTQIEKLHLISPSGDFEMYEDDLAAAFCRLIETARFCFDTVIISAGTYFYDELVCYSLSLSDHIISVIRGHSESIRAQGRAVSFLCHKRVIAAKNISQVVFDYRIESDLSRGTISQLSQYPLIGFISENRHRRQQKCSALPYAARISKQNAREYKSLLARLKSDFKMSGSREVV